jgi:hypothetical protein
MVPQGVQVQKVAYIYVLVAEWVWFPMIWVPTWRIIINLNTSDENMDEHK